MPQQYVVPQHTDKEDTIFGPITVRQFLICLVGSGLVFVISQLLSGVALYVVAGPITVFIIILAFVKVNGYPMHFFIFNFFMYLKKPNFRVWALQESKSTVSTKSPIKRLKFSQNVTTSLSRLSELSLIVDTGGMFRGTSKTISQSNNDEEI